MNRNLMVVLLVTVGMIFSSACSTSKKIQTVQMGDNNLTKKELIAEMKKLDDAQADIESNKGVTGTNVAAALFWLPGLAYTYYDAGEATRLISERRAHLTAIYNKKYGESDDTSLSGNDKRSS